MKKKNKKFLWIGGAVVLAIAIFFILGVQQSVIGVSETITWETTFDFSDGQTGTSQAEGYITLPTDTTTFGFTPDYNLKTIYKSSTTGRANVKYEIFNYQTNSWETIHDKSWSIPNADTETNIISMDGETVYQTGIPEKFDSVYVAYKTYDRYYGCLNGMSVEEAKELEVWVEGTSTYNYKCIYPDNSLTIKDYDDPDVDIEYFPPLITKDANYLNEENKMLIRVTYNPTSAGFRSMDEGDFRIKFWDVQTPKVSVWTFENGTCNEYERFTYQTLSTDFFTENECKIANNLTIIIEEPIDEPVIDPITGEVISGGDEETNVPVIFMWSMIIVAVLAIVIVFMKRRKK